MSKTEEQEKLWKDFQKKALDLAAKRGDLDYYRYASSMTERAWKHVFKEQVYSPHTAEIRLWGFYQQDLKFREPSE